MNWQIFSTIGYLSIGLSVAALAAWLIHWKKPHRWLPVIGLAICASTGNIYAGLLYPITVASITFIVGSIFLKETKHVRIWDEVS